MRKQSPESLDRAIAAILRFPPIMRKIQREFFAKGQHRAGITIAYHHVMIMRTLHDFGMLNSSDLGAITFVSKAR